MDLEKDNQPKVVDLDEKRQREERLMRLQKMIDAGEYKIAAQDIADSWLSKENFDEIQEESESEERPSSPHLVIEKNSKTTEEP